MFHEPGCHPSEQLFTMVKCLPINRKSLQNPKLVSILFQTLAQLCRITKYGCTWEFIKRLHVPIQVYQIYGFRLISNRKTLSMHTALNYQLQQFIYCSKPHRFTSTKRYLYTGRCKLKIENNWKAIFGKYQWNQFIISCC